MKQKLFSFFLAVIGITLTASADVVTAQWNWQTNTPEGISSFTTIQNNTGFLSSDVDGIELYVDATNGKLSPNGNNAQFNAGTILHIPVISTNDVVTVTGYPNLSNYCFDGGTSLQNTNTYTANSFDVNRGYVEVTSTTGGGYLYAVSVAQDTEAAATAFKNFAVDLTDGNLLEAAEKVQWQSVGPFGIAVATDGTISRVAADAANAACVVSGSWHSNNYGWANLVVTVPVDGAVKVTLGTNNASSEATIKNGTETVATLNVSGSNWDSSNTDRVVSDYYKGSDATTLTINAGSYQNYFAIEAVDPSTLIDNATVSFAAGEATGATVPASITGEVGASITLPRNYTMYVEGKTLTGWSDGTTTYSLGSEYTVPESDIELIPVFTQNAVSLDDRMEAVTVKWNFRRDQGAPVVQWQNVNGNVWVTQVTIDNETIDVPMTVNTNPGKFNNSGNTDWAQLNSGTKFTIPSCKGATVSMEAYNDITTTTIDGQSDYTQGKTISYEVENTSETIDVVIGDGSYYRYIQTVLPFIDTRTPSNLTLTSDASLSLDAGQSQTSQITYTTSSTGAITYESNNTGIATVDNSGLITAVGNGTATITVTQAADATYAAGSATVTVTVTGGTAPTINVAAILNDNAGTLITTDEINNKSTVNFGINAYGVRVAVDAQDKVATVSGKYHSEHGLTGLAFSVDVPGNVKISVGECTYSGKTITVKNSNNVTVASTTPENACWKNSTSNVAILYYEGGATTLTISGMDYCPYVAVESVENVPELHTINYYNGSTLVSTSQVYDGTSLGTLPTPEYDSNSQYFVGWYSDADDMGTKAFASTVPAGDATYYAVLIDAPTATAGYYTPTTAAELIGTINYANANASQNNPVKIFLKNGTYDLGSAAEITQLTGSYISLIGESLEGTIITNIPEQEGLDKGTLLYNKGNYNYLQDLTLHNNYPYGNSTGRAASLKDEGNYTICKNVWLYSHQDTYYSHSTGGYFYFNGGKISGCVDYMCGQSRVYFDGVTLSNDDKTSYMTANSELYVFNNCIVENNGSNTYYWGRSWSSVNGGPRCIFINTTLKDNGSHLGNTRWLAAGMNDPYVRAGEYGTKNAAGTDITPSSNIVNFTSNSGNVSFETILTADEAANYTLANIFGEWGEDATEQAQQVTVSNVVLSGTTLSWDGTSDAYLIEKNGEFVALTSENSYTVEDDDTYTVRAANGRGGFGEAVESIEANLTLTTTQNMAGYKSFYSADKSYVADDNTKVYRAEEVKGDKVLLYTIDNDIPAGTPVILKTTSTAEVPTPAAYYQMTLTYDSSIQPAYANNLLKVTEGGEDFSQGVYRIGWKEGDGVGFFTWTTESATANVVYLDKVNATGAKLTFVFFDEEEEEATGVNVVNEDDETAPADTYNALGQRVDANAKGLVITNGKKYVK